MPTYLKYEYIFFFISISFRIRIRNIFPAVLDPDPWKKMSDPHPWLKLLHYCLSIYLHNSIFYILIIFIILSLFLFYICIFIILSIYLFIYLCIQELLKLLHSKDHAGTITCADGDVLSETDLNRLLDRSNLSWGPQEWG